MVKDVDLHMGPYDPAVVRILGLAGEGKRLMPLVHTACISPVARESINQLDASPLVKAGLYLYFSCWDEAHAASDSVETTDGYFWHAIVHRQEPDAANAAYWFRRTGAHAIFPQLAAEAATCGYKTGPVWDPFGFIRFCETAEQNIGSAAEQTALEVQLIEWQLLFDHCMRDHRMRDRRARSGRN
jgi:hypothetical protein